MVNGEKVVIDSDQLREYFLFHQKRQISILFKSFLTILEEVRDKRYHIDDDTYDTLRKKVLDLGNDTLRDSEENINKFNFSLRHETTNS